MQDIIKTHQPLSVREEELGKIIVNAAYNVHSKLGPGLLEKIYEVCFCHELKKIGVQYKRQIEVPIHYDEITFDEGLRLDVFVDDLVVCEIKAIEEVNPVWSAQILSHLKLINRRLGYLINFDVPLIKNGIKRFVVD